MSRVLFSTRWRAVLRVARAGRARCLVRHSRAMSRVFARRLHAAVLFHALHVSSRSANLSRLESLILFKLLI